MTTRMSTLDDTMDALVWLGPRDMVQRSVPIPRLEDGDVLVEVGAAGICGSELSGFLGQNSLRMPPLIMGHESAGHVVETTTGTFATGQPPTVGTRVTFNPLVVCGTCDRCRVERDTRANRGRLAGGQRPRRRLHDVPRTFMSHDEWRHAQTVLAQETAQLRTADADRAHRNQHVAVRQPQHRLRALHHVARAKPDQRIHRIVQSSHCNNSSLLGERFTNPAVEQVDNDSHTIAIEMHRLGLKLEAVLYRAR